MGRRISSHIRSRTIDPCLRVPSEVVVVLYSVSALSALKDLPKKRGETYLDMPSLTIAERYVLVLLFPNELSC